MASSRVHSSTHPVLTSRGVEPGDTGGGGGGGGESAELPGPGQSLSGRWGRAQPAPPPLQPPPRPAPHALGSTGSWRSAGGLPGTPASRPLPAAHPGPPLPSRGTRSCRRGASGNSLDPCARRCPVCPPATPPRGRCPGALPHGAGRRAPSAPGAVTQVGAVCRSRPDPCGSCAVAPGSPVPLGCEPPTPRPSRPARHGQHPPLPLAAASPTRAPAAARAVRAPVLPPAAGCRPAQVSPHLMLRPPGELGPPATGASGAPAGAGDPGRREGQCRRRVLVPNESALTGGRGAGDRIWAVQGDRAVPSRAMATRREGVCTGGGEQRPSWSSVLWGGCTPP